MIALSLVLNRYETGKRVTSATSSLLAWNPPAVETPLGALSMTSLAGNVRQKAEIGSRV